jgi:hypothetical protein
VAALALCAGCGEEARADRDRGGAVKGKHAVYTDATLSGAMYFVTPLPLQYVLDRLIPALADAMAGKSPETMVGG